MSDRPAVHVRHSRRRAIPAAWIVTCDACTHMWPVTESGADYLVGHAEAATLGAWAWALRLAVAHAATRDHRIAVADRAGASIRPCSTTLVHTFGGRPVPHDPHWWRTRLGGDVWCPGSGRTP